jgi:threonine synthase
MPTYYAVTETIEDKAGIIRPNDQESKARVSAALGAISQKYRNEHSSPPALYVTESLACDVAVLKAKQNGRAFAVIKVEVSVAVSHVETVEARVEIARKVGAGDFSVQGAQWEG